MAFYGSLGEVNFENLDASIADTAVDVFVYDTSKDSDGGAWRKRTQHTSWYNETLNTATRGSRREFPAVAVIVTTNSGDNGQVIIYDGDDPDMPMWMKFNVGYNSPNRKMIGVNSAENLTSSSMLNAKLVTGTRDGASDDGGVYIIDFIKDNRLLYQVGGYFGPHILNEISNRNVSTTSRGTQFGPVTLLVKPDINDVAMTVLPNAPIDAATGLPIPTIAVATDAGVSVIKDDGQVFNLTFSGQNGNKVWKVTFDDRHQICMLLGYSNVWPYTSYIYHVPSSDTSLSPVTDRVLNNFTYNFPSDAYGAQNSSSGDINAYIDSKYFGTDKGMSFLTPNKDDIGGQLICHINTEFNSGWMHGDIKGAFLSDTSTASVTGTELITNGTFSTSDLSAWTTIAGGTAVITGGLLKLTDTVGAFCYASAPFVTVIGKQYVVSVDIVNNSNTASSHYIRIGHSHDETQNHNVHYGSSYGTKIIYFIATATTTYLTLISGLGVGTFGHWDNVSVRLADPDRSVNNKGLQVFGTITKSAVATGADLVGYSGFSESDYLKQPHNSSLEFGTGSFSCTVWFKSSTADVSNYKGLVYLNQNGILGEGFQILLNPSNGIYFYIYGSTNDFSGAGHTGYNDGNWHQISVSSTGTHQRVYLDGVLKETGNITTGSITDTSSELSIGKWYGNTSSLYYWRGSIALCRISGSIPSPEQIKKIYEDEKVLFQENAKCTLYGSSDAVTALAYDDDNQLLHVGTSSGRSDFQGLRRINNTTTAVTTAISASNGLIIEQ